MRFTLCVRGTHCGNEPGLVRPEGCHIFIQNEALEIGEEHANHQDHTNLLGNADFIVDFPKFDYTPAKIGTFHVYRGFSTSLKSTEKLWDHYYCHGYAEDGRSFRYMCQHVGENVGKFVSLISVPFMDSIYPIVTYSLSGSNYTSHFMTVTRRYVQWAEVTHTLTLVILHGRNDSEISNIAAYEMDAVSLMNYADKIHDLLMREVSETRHFALLISKHMEMDAFTLDPINFIKRFNKWNFLPFEEGLTDRYGEPGYWHLIGYRCSKFVKVSRSMIHVDDRGTSIFEVDIPGEQESRSRVIEISKDLWTERNDTIHKVMLKADHKDIEEIESTGKGNTVPMTRYLDWSEGRKKTGGKKLLG